MKNLNNEEGIDLRLLISKFLGKWYLFIAMLGICLFLAYLKIRTSPQIYEVYSIMKMNVGSSKSDKILDATNFEKRDVNVEDEIIAINSTNFIKQALTKLNFNISLLIC